MALVGTIAANLTAGTAAFEAGMNKAGGLIKNLQSQLSKRLTLNIDLGSVFTKLKDFAAAGFENGVALAALSEQLGIGADKLAGLQLAADYAEVSQEDLTTALQKLSKNIGAATLGSGELVDSFEKLGLDADRLAEMPLEQAMAEIADAIGRVDNKYQQAAIASEIFGRGGIKLMNILRGGSAELAKATEDARKFGTAISADSVERFKAFDDQMDKLTAAAKGLGLTLSTVLLPALTDILETMQQIVSLRFDEFLGKVAVMPTIKLPEGAIERAKAKQSAGQNQPGAPIDIDLGFNDAMQRALKIMEDLKTPVERFRDRVDELFELAQMGALSWEEYDRAVQASFDETGPGRMIRDLEEQVRLWGMTDDEIMRYRAAAEGASVADQLRIRLLQEQRELLQEQQDEYDEIARRQEEMGDAGAALTRAMRNPLEEFTDRLEEIFDLFAEGIINQDTFDRAITQAAEQLERSLPQLRLGGRTGFAEVGSQDAFRTLNQNQNQNPATRRLDDIVREAREQNRRLREIGENTAREAIGLGII